MGRTTSKTNTQELRARVGKVPPDVRQGRANIAPDTIGAILGSLSRTGQYLGPARFRLQILAVRPQKDSSTWVLVNKDVLTSGRARVPRRRVGEVTFDSSTRSRRPWRGICAVTLE